MKGWRSWGLGLLVLAGVAIWAINGESSTGQKDGPPPFTANDSQARAECVAGTYISSRAGIDTRLTEGLPPRNWKVIESTPGAIQPDRSAVVVTLRPKRHEEITLTGIRFEVEQHELRPLGTVFYRPCKEPLVGPAIEADVDQAGEVQGSSAALDGAMGTGLRLPSSAKPIEFPWTVSLDKPFRLYLVVHAEYSYCSWSARIPWSSNSSEGVIHVDNGGRGYRITDSIGIPWDRPMNGKWRQGLAPRWTEAD
jgi:hypothetical protein